MASRKEVEATLKRQIGRLLADVLVLNGATTETQRKAHVETIKAFVKEQNQDKCLAIVIMPDTVGYATPAEFGALIAGIDAHVPNIGQAVISVHGHNDLGLAVANFLEAVKNGSRQLECTINGIGERAGNASLEELVMALHVRRSYFNGYLGRAEDSSEPLTGIQTEEIYKT